MSCTLCSCSGTLGNTGTPNKQSVIKAGTKLIAVPLQASDGTRNQILDTDTLDATFFSGKFQETDETKRWYPIGTFDQVTSERADPNTEGLNDGSSLITKQGVRTWQGWLIKYSPVYIGKIESHACGKFGVYIVDDCGDLIGSYCSDGGGSGVDALRPIAVNEASVYARYIMQQDANVGKVQLDFEFSQLEKDQSLRKIEATDISGVNLLDETGLLDLSVSYTSPIATSVTANVTLNYDGVFTSTTINGLALADFSAFNTTTQAAVTIDSVTNSGDGVYDIAYSSGVSSTDVVQFSIVNDTYYSQQSVTIA